jgi:hypothetical protein
MTMNRHTVRWAKLAMVALPLALAAGCASSLNPEDRASITEARDAARQAQASASQAQQSANEAKAAAQQAQQQAAAASQRADQAMARNTRTK